MSPNAHQPLRAVPAVIESDSPFRRWPGGRARKGALGEAFYIRERLPGGRRVEIALGIMPEGEAMAEWALYRQDREAYKPPKTRAAEAIANGDSNAPVRLDLTTLGTFGKWADLEDKAGRLSHSYVRNTLKKYLREWGEALKERDLHTVTLDQLQTALQRWETAQHKRIIALKAFTKWAREVKPAPKLRRQFDPTLDLRVPEVTPEKKRRKKGYAIDRVENTYRVVDDQAVRDLIRLRVGAAGLHDTEIDRLARGEGELRRIDDSSGIAGLLVFEHKKKGGDHAISVDAATFAAAERLRALGKAPSNSHVHDHLHRAAIKLHGCEGVSRNFGDGSDDSSRIEACLKCPRIVPSELRHSFATWARTLGEIVRPANQKGVDLATVSERMGHTSKATTKGFYLGDHVPEMIRVPVKLEHPDDPALKAWVSSSL